MTSQNDWVSAISQAASSPSFAQDLKKSALLPELRTGAALNLLVDQQISDYKKLALEFGLAR